jgi:hypothetical protein
MHYVRNIAKISGQNRIYCQKGDLRDVRYKNSQ